MKNINEKISSEIYIVPQVNSFKLASDLVCGINTNYNFNNFNYEINSVHFEKTITVFDENKICGYIDIFKIKYRCLDTCDLDYSEQLVGFVFM